MTYYAGIQKELGGKRGGNGVFRQIYFKLANLRDLPVTPPICLLLCFLVYSLLVTFSNIHF